MNDTAPHQSPLPHSQKPQLSGKDELNLAEFPLTKLGKRDQREVLTYEGWAIDKRKHPYRMSWTARGASGLGLPHELGDQVILALLHLTFRSRAPERKVEFSLYQLLKIMGSDPQGQHTYDRLTMALRQLAGMTLESNRSFYDREAKKRVIHKSFHLIEKLWLRKYEDDEQRREAPAQGYIIWSQEIWRNLSAGYIKNLDLGFYYRLPSPLSRRLFRFLDRRFRHQNQFEIDVFELAGRVGLAYYHKPAEAFRKLKPGIDHLIDAAYLTAGEKVKCGKYTRVRFVKATASAKQHRHKQNILAHNIESVRRTWGSGERVAELDRQLKQQLQGQLSQATYSFLKELHLLAVEEQRVVCGSTNGFALAWLEKNLKEQICSTLAALLDDEQVEIVFQELAMAGATDIHGYEKDLN